MNLTRVWAVILRHYFMTLHHMERFFDVLLFPIMTVVLWGFVTRYIQNIQFQTLATFLLGGLILWVIFERVGTDIGISFMYDVWERNVVNFLSTPLTFLEYLTGLVTISLIKIIISFIAMWLIASLFFNFQITSLGFSLALFWINLIITAMAFGIFNITMVLKFGHGVGPLTWILPFFLQPFAAVFYPVSVLPAFLQKIAYILPLSHVFEGMRFVLKTGVIDWNEFFLALLLSSIYLIVNICLFAWVLSIVKKSGQLVKIN